MTTEFDREIENVIRGRLAGTTLRQLQPILAQLEAEVDKRVMRMMKANKGLTEQQALQAWYEKAAVVQLREKLEQLANAGAAAGQRISGTMEIVNG